MTANKSYKISFDYNDFLNLDFDLDEVFETMETTLGERFWDFSWDSIALQEYWGTFNATFEDIGIELEKKPDVTIWNAACLFLSPKAYTQISEYLAPYGEFLPVSVDGKTHYIFNCLNTVEADKSVSKADIQDGLWQGVKSLGFTDNDIKNNLIFKTRFDRCSSLYCGETFKNLIQSKDLDGLLFNDDLLTSF